MSKKSSKKRWVLVHRSPLHPPTTGRDEVDIIQTACWFDHFLGVANLRTPYAAERLVEPEAFGVKEGVVYHRNKWAAYARGQRTPHASLRDRAEQAAPGTRWIFDHAMWEALRTERRLGQRIEPLLRTLEPKVQTVVFDSNSLRGLKRRPIMAASLKSLEEMAGFDSLACLTLLLREAHERADAKQAHRIALSLFKVLVIVCMDCSLWRIVPRWFSLYRDRIFPLAALRNRTFRLQEYDIEEVVEEFTRILLVAEDHGDRHALRGTTHFMLRAFRGGLTPRAALFLRPPIGPSGPTCAVELQLAYERCLRLRRWAIDAIRSRSQHTYPPASLLLGLSTRDEGTRLTPVAD